MGTLGALRFVVNAMRDFPGRKSVILFTENIRLIYRGATDEMVAQRRPAAQRRRQPRLRGDPRHRSARHAGLRGQRRRQYRAACRAGGFRAFPRSARQEVVHTEEGMFALAEDTGGLFLHDTNDLAGALRKAAEDSDGYYLIGYHPDANTFENGSGQPKFHASK